MDQGFFLSKMSVAQLAERRIPNPQVGGSRPSWHAKFIALAYARAECVGGSYPPRSICLIGLSSSGRTPDFDSGNCRFESSRASQLRKLF